MYWVLMNSLIFTWSSEKMPWQNLHLTLPLGLLGGWFLGAVWEGTDWRELGQRGARLAALWLPVALLSLLVLLKSMLAGPGPFEGVALEQLHVSLRWMLALVVLGVAVFLLRRFARGLGWQDWSRLALVAVVLVLGALTLRVALRLSFVNHNYATEFLVYAAATPDTGMVMRELEEMSTRLAGDKELRIAYDDESSWPYVWYLRDFKNTSYFTAGTGLSGEPDVVLIGPGNESKVKSQLAGRYLSRGYRLIWWPNQDVYSNLTPASLWRDIRDPIKRSYWWGILWAREYPQSTTSWPYVQRFALYVRKDVAAKLWDYGPEVAGGGVELPEDAYEKKRVQLTALSSWGNLGSADGQLNYPKDLDVDTEGNVYVADSYNHRVQVFDAQGRFLRKWGFQGAGPGQFQEPWGVAVDEDGHVYVADTWNHRVQKFDASGQFLRQWGYFGDSAGALGDTDMMYGPRDVAVDAAGNVLVSDTGNKRVLSFTPEGQFVRQWGGSGSLDGQLREPVGLAVDGSGHVYIADTWNRRIQQFDSQGVFVRQWPVLGWEGEGVTNKPYVAVDEQGNVYATAPDYNRVVKFDGTGAVAAIWGQYGSDLGSLNMPSGIVVDGDGSVLVLDSSNHRVVRFGGVP
jgi:DNA-binding beta-propeller fold protein YncE